MTTTTTLESIPDQGIPQLLKKDDVCRQFQIKLRTLNRLMSQGEIRYMKIGRSVRFHPETILEDLEGFFA